jgi:hypothetical protein
VAVVLVAVDMTAAARTSRWAAPVAWSVALVAWAAGLAALVG